MGINFMRFALGMFWLVLSVTVFFREYLGPVVMARFDTPNSDFLAMFALALAGWNLARWYAGWARRASGTGVIASRPIERRTEPDRPFEYNPELDFTKPAPDEKPHD